MFITLRQGRIKSGTADELARRVEQGLVSILAGSPGFEAYHLLHTDDDTIVTVSAFATKAKADQSNRQALDWIKQNLSDLLLAPPQVTEGQVLVHAGK